MFYLQKLISMKKQLKAPITQPKGDLFDAENIGQMQSKKYIIPIVSYV
jgi:hypothetical protein